MFLNLDISNDSAYTQNKHIAWPADITLEFCRVHIQIRCKQRFQKVKHKLYFNCI
jgi:hypothetical protein